MAQQITIEPLTRIEGHARVVIELDDRGNVSDTRLQITSLRGFEQFIVGRPAEEIPRIVTRICGICPWMHHLASVKAVDGCFRTTPTPTGHKLRELCQTMAHIDDKILHFFFLAAPDFLLDPDSDLSVRSIMSIAEKYPDLAARVVEMRRLGHSLLQGFAGRALHPVAGVTGGFAKPMSKSEHEELTAGVRRLLDFSCFALEYAKEKVFHRFDREFCGLGTVCTGFLGTVDNNGALNLYDGRMRLMRADGQITDFSPADYLDHLAEHTVPWSYAKMVYAASWNEGFSLDPGKPRGIYRANTLARINVCDHIATPRAQEALEEFRTRFGRPAQATLLYHWARLIEMIHACERSLELLDDDTITYPDIRAAAEPCAGRGIGHVEAPRGTLIHDYATDENGCISQANIIVGTTHNTAAMNLSVRRAAEQCICEGTIDEPVLNRVEMAVRAYDP